jgi:hypothetical protein
MAYNIFKSTRFTFTFFLLQVHTEADDDDVNEEANNHEMIVIKIEKSIS